MTERKKHPEWFREDLSRLLAMLRENSIRPVVAERLPLAEAGRAHELLEHASVSGVIVLMCQECSFHFRLNQHCFCLRRHEIK
jgi:NADPH:quinone reductase-like Zn-dependent oxidoreductase